MCKLLWLSILFFLSGCSSLPAKKYQPMMDVAHLPSFVATQQWDIKFKQKDFHAQIVVQTIDNGWQWIVLNDFGQRQASVTSTNGVLVIEEYQTSQITDYLDQLVMAWQLMFWPVESIHLSNQHQWICKAEANHRKVYFEGQLYATISFAGNDIADIKVEYESVDMQISLSSYPLM